MGQWRRRRKSQSTINRTESKVSHKSSQFVSQKPASQPKVPWRKQLRGPVASSKEVLIRQKPNQVESQREVETISQPETSQSAGSALAATIRWVSGSSKVVQVSRKPKKVERQPQVESVCQPEPSQSAGSALAATFRCVSGVVEESPCQPKNESRKSAISRVIMSARIQSVSRMYLGGFK